MTSEEKETSAGGESCRSEFLGRYAAYKNATDSFFQWIKYTTAKVLENCTESKDHVKIYEATQNVKVKLCQIHQMVETLEGNLRLDLLTGFSAAIKACKKAISLREEVSSYFSSLPGNQKSEDTNQSDTTHKYFISLLKKWLKILLNSVHGKKEMWGEQLKNNSQQSEGEDHEGTFPSIENIYIILQEIEGEFSEGEDSDSEIKNSYSQSSDSTEKQGDSNRQEDLDRNDDICFAIQCLLMDLEIIMEQIHQVWSDVKNGQTNYISGSAAVIVGLRRVSALTSELQLHFPAFETFEDIARCGIKLVDQSQQSVEQTGFLDILHGSPEYKPGSLVVDMNFTAFCLKTFATAIPADHSKMMVTKRGFFGPAFDEARASIKARGDFFRFLSQLLPLVNNDIKAFLHLNPRRYEEMFCDKKAQFSILGELLGEYRKFFYETKCTLPLVFALTCLFRSISVLQGGMFLTQTTALTKMALWEVQEALETSLATGDIKAIDEGLEQHLLCIKEGVEYMLKTNSLFQNNPLHAGALALDVLMSQTLTAGSNVLMRTSRFRSACHLYSALKCKGYIGEMEIMEHLLSIYEDFVFIPSRPDSNFKKIYALSSHVKATTFSAQGQPERPKFETVKSRKRFDPQDICPLYEILVLNDLTALKHSSFPELFEKVKKQAEHDHLNSGIIGFNLVALHGFFTTLFEKLKDGLDRNQVYVDWLVNSDKQMQVFALEASVMFELLENIEEESENPLCSKAAGIVCEVLGPLRQEDFDLFHRTKNLHAAEFGGPLEIEQDEKVVDEDYSAWGRMMDILGSETDGPLTPREMREMKDTIIQHPRVMLLHSNGEEFSSIKHQVAAGPRASQRMLEWLIPMDPWRSPGNTWPCHVCAKTGNEESARILLSPLNFEDLDCQSRETGDTMLHYAARSDKLKVVEFLTHKMANPTIKNIEGKTALDVAVSDEVKEELKRHMDHCDIEKQRLTSTASDRAQSEVMDRGPKDPARIRLNQKRLQRQAQERVVRVVSEEDKEKALQAEKELLSLLDAEEEKVDQSNFNKKNKKKKKKKR